MNDEMEQLARRAVACVPIEEWPAGARFFEFIDHKNGHGPCRIVDTREWSALQKGYWYIDDSDGHQCSRMNLAQKQGRLIPDLTDPATLGCLLHLVREAWGDSGAYVSPHPHFYDNGEFLWRVHAGGRFLPIPSKGSHSEAHALINALEAANE